MSLTPVVDWQTFDFQDGTRRKKNLVLNHFKGIKRVSLQKKGQTKLEMRSCYDWGFYLERKWDRQESKITWAYIFTTVPVSVGFSSQTFRFKEEKQKKYVKLLW